MWEYIIIRLLMFGGYAKKGTQLIMLMDCRARE